MKKVLILSGSPRKGGNSDILCDRFAMTGRTKWAGRSDMYERVLEKHLPIQPQGRARKINLQMFRGIKFLKK